MHPSGGRPVFKVCTLYCLKHPFTASTVVQTFLSNIYKLHGLPQAIVSDRDKIFTSTFRRELFKLAGVELRVNQCLETFLRCFVHACPKQWLQWLDQAELWYNTSWHSALNRSPFEVLYGYGPRQFGVIGGDEQPVSDLSSWLADRTLMTDVIRLHLNRAKQRMKCQADTKRSERQFQVGESVYVKIQPYVYIYIVYIHI